MFHFMFGDSMLYGLYDARDTCDVCLSSVILAAGEGYFVFGPGSEFDVLTAKRTKAPLVNQRC